MSFKQIDRIVKSMEKGTFYLKKVNSLIFSFPCVVPSILIVILSIQGGLMHLVPCYFREIIIDVFFKKIDNVFVCL